MRTINKIKIIEHTDHRKFEELVNARLDKYNNDSRLVELETHITTCKDAEGLDVFYYTAIIKIMRFIVE